MRMTSAQAEQCILSALGQDYSGIPSDVSYPFNISQGERLIAALGGSAVAADDNTAITTMVTASQGERMIAAAQGQSVAPDDNTSIHSPMTSHQAMRLVAALNGSAVPDYKDSDQYISMIDGALILDAIGGVSRYSYIDPVDSTVFPVHNGLILLTVDGTEEWSLISGAVYTSAYKNIIQNQSRESVCGYCADYTFEQSSLSIASMSNDAFIFNGTSSNPVNGNLSFKNEHTSSVAAWKDYLSEHPVTILISTNNPDASVWKPAKSGDITGYWDGASFVEDDE